MSLFRDVAPGQALRIGDTVVQVEHKTGNRVRLRIDSPHPVEHVTAAKPQLSPASPPATPGPAPAAPSAGQVLPLLRRPAAA